MAAAAARLRCGLHASYCRHSDSLDAQAATAHEQTSVQAAVAPAHGGGEQRSRWRPRRRAGRERQRHQAPLSGASFPAWPLRPAQPPWRQAFYEARGHKVLPSSSLVPDDPTVLLTIAGSAQRDERDSHTCAVFAQPPPDAALSPAPVLQFKPVFLGLAPRAVARAATTQKCVRTNDIENVGVTKRHHTFFEMLGNFSFGDYFKRDAILWAWQLATQEFGLPPHRVWVSVYERDDEALALWRDVVGVPEAHIQRLGDKDNFWSAGPTGPCGPCSELYYDFSPERGDAGASLEDDSRFIEFYNLVFMQSERDAQGVLTPLAAPCIDTGMGLERMAQILQRVPNNYETDLIFPIVQRAAQLAGLEYAGVGEAERTRLKVLGDHVRACVYLLSDGVLPSNVGRGYVVRRLVRRAVRCGRLLGVRSPSPDPGAPFLPELARVAVALSAACDPAVTANAERVCSELAREEGRFGATLAKGEQRLDDALRAAHQAARDTGEAAVLPGEAAFELYDTFGFPVEITAEVAQERGVALDHTGFDAALQAARALSRAACVSGDPAAGAAMAALAEEARTGIN